MDGQANRSNSGIVVSIDRNFVRGSTMMPKKVEVTACTEVLAM